MKILFLTLSLILFCLFSFAQEILTAQQAIALALENNYDIQISNQQLAIAKNNTNFRNTGLLPSLTGTGGYNYNKSDIDVVFNDGRSTELNGAEAEGYNAALNLDYIIFDGLGRMYNYKKLKELYQLSELEARVTIENTLLQLMNAYYNVALLTENRNNFKNALDISKQRMLRVATQTEYGQASQLALLNAQVDVNNDSINLLTIEQQLSNAKNNLNLILGREITQTFEVDTQVAQNQIMSKEALIEQVKSNNTQLLQTQKNQIIAKYDLNLNRTNMLPDLRFNGAYAWNKNNNNSASFVQTQKANGINAGLTLSWTLFDGGKNSIAGQNAKLNIKTQEILKTKTEQQLLTDFENIFGNYQTQLFILSAQSQNVATAQNNFNRAEEAFKTGQITSIEFRQAQLNLLNALMNKNQAKYDAKNSELMLLQLNGQLLETTF